MKTQHLVILIWIATLVIGGVPAQATLILDADFFSTIPHTLITFETDRGGNQIHLASGDFQNISFDEYSAEGFTFASGLSSEICWVNDMSPDADAAQAIGGSLEIAIAASDNQGDYVINFSDPIRSFGFWVYHNNTHPYTLAFHAYDASGLIEIANFEGEAIDGTIGKIDYGFLGITSDKYITSIHVTGDIAILDNFRFSPIPEPATLSLLGMGGLALLRRRRDKRSAKLKS